MHFATRLLYPFISYNTNAGKWNKKKMDENDGGETIENLIKFITNVIHPMVSLR